MVSDRRIEFRTAISEYSDIMNLQGKKVLDIGIAGDPEPGENYQWFGKGNTYETLDVDSTYNPTYTGDIVNAPFDDNSFELVILSNVIEHIWDYTRAISEVARITSKYAIIDCPLQIGYHAEGQFDDYWRFTTRCLVKLAEQAGFEVISQRQTKLISTILCVKLES